MSFLVAWQLLTAIPVGRRGLAAQRPVRSLAWFPLIGLILGAMLAGFDFLFTQLLPDLPAAALLLVAGLPMALKEG